MRHFTTTCDINYLPQGLALYNSLMKVNPDFTLYWLCIDNKMIEILEKLKLPNVVLDFAQTRFPKNDFSYKEYCWSLASRFTWYVMDKFKVPDIAYLDADLYFYQDYELIYKEIGNKSIGIVEHRIPTYKNVGKYNVGFVYFKNDKPGSTCLKRWSNLVANKDNDYFQEYGCMADQKYLELFPIWFTDKVHIINCGQIAWWNSKYNTFINDSIIFEGQKQLLIFIHFSHFRLLEPSGYTHSEMKEMPPRLKQYYDDYEQEVRKAKRIYETILHRE